MTPADMIAKITKALNHEFDTKTYLALCVFLFDDVLRQEKNACIWGHASNFMSTKHFHLLDFG